MKKILITSTLLLTSVVSASAFAATVTKSSHKTLVSKGFETKEAAYDAGYDTLESLGEASQMELKNQLWVSDFNARKIMVNKSAVQVKEYSEQRGEVLYSAVVDVNYQYQTHDND